MLIISLLQTFIYGRENFRVLGFPFVPGNSGFGLPARYYFPTDLFKAKHINHWLSIYDNPDNYWPLERQFFQSNVPVGSFGLAAPVNL